ncbi:hypothetical protein A5733_14815 [Mycobacterium sp. NS-7484]|uniref:SEC-C domain-containing protein n=1 Tax=Mycobacterium sp. NS-7484 TaxID=1834161 RepID=UPI00096F4CBF|nr:SEC-C domain-containing protein [Mycobacterium sp. NS-7484]OMB94431.1 hypothetical protein A5733_14815 [Mycobacterium sp. NS-7484]
MADAFDPVQAVAEILTEHGPLSEDDLMQRLRERGRVNLEFDDLLDEIGDPIDRLLDETWVWLPTLLHGRVFTHRLTADEAAHDLLATTPDLDPVIALSSDEQFGGFVDGSPAQIVLRSVDAELLEQRQIPLEVVDPRGALLLPSGTLATLQVSEGDLVGVRWTGRGLAVERVDATGQAEVGARLAALLDDHPIDFETAVQTLCAEDPQLFTEAVPPLSQIAADHGLARFGALLAPPGFDFPAWQFERGYELFRDRYELDPGVDAVAVYTLTKLHDQLRRTIETAGAEGSTHTIEELLEDTEESADSRSFLAIASDFGEVLADPELAEILADAATHTGRAGAAALGLLAEALESKLSRPARVGCRWLQAVALERTGAVEQAEQQLLQAESLDTTWEPVLFNLARFASDRGDVERALSLLRRAGAEPDDPMVLLLERHRAQPRSDLGRNDVCWCGSGRKYKKCHLGREQLPLAERVDWLYAKAVQHLMSSDWDLLLESVRSERGYYAEDDDELFDAITDPLVIDAVLFEGGAFGEFVDQRGPLLPDDERLLAEQWLLVQRSVFEVEQVQRGRGITVRDLRTGDIHDVQEAAGSRQLKAGQMICARVVPAGDTMQIFGGIEPVALHERASLIELLDTEPDAIELVAFLTQRFAPPTLTNTEGDSLVACEATLRVADPADLSASLDTTFDRVADEDPPRWLERVVTHGMPRIRAMIDLDGDALHIATNSEQRMDRVLATLKQLAPTLVIVEESRVPMGDLREASAVAQALSARGAQLDPMSPEVAAVLNEAILAHEAQWLDEPIPALDGHTPRQAADDPTRRGDLIKLLDSFPAVPGGMDADRLRKALGLA